MHDWWVAAVIHEVGQVKEFNEATKSILYADPANEILQPPITGVIIVNDYTRIDLYKM